LAYRQEHIDCGEHIHGSNQFEEVDDYESWLEKVQKERATARHGWVVNDTYFVVVGGKIVGMVNIRHSMNAHISKWSGHIGYGVRPSERYKGYATKMLSLALDKCRELNIDRVLVTCDKDNAGSAKTITKNGGILENEFVEENGNIVKRYWIDL